MHLPLCLIVLSLVLGLRKVNRLSFIVTFKAVSILWIVIRAWSSSLSLKYLGSHQVTDSVLILSVPQLVVTEVVMPQNRLLSSTTIAKIFFICITNWRGLQILKTNLSVCCVVLCCRTFLILISLWRHFFGLLVFCRWLGLDWTKSLGKQSRMHATLLISQYNAWVNYWDTLWRTTIQKLISEFLTVYLIVESNLGARGIMEKLTVKSTLVLISSSSDKLPIFWLNSKPIVYRCASFSIWMVVWTVWFIAYVVYFCSTLECLVKLRVKL